ncbi:MAG: septum formation inhibitor Maf [Clostridia bacterium]|nr:septum formation inhibitor Maf [Clostridia bacterium]
MKDIILASASPRRRELLQLAGVNFTVDVADADETLENGISPDEAVKKLAQIKAKAVFAKHPDSIVIGADTVVAIDGKILGKPKNYNEANEMLNMLSGKKHYVFTGVCIMTNEKATVLCQKTAVEFYSLSQNEIDEYISSGDCFDKAGGYGIQTNGCVLVKGIEGDYFNVVGLPVAETVRALKEIQHG